ncbi:MAG: 50S ribosomal protein L15 [Deltaproteobacteria bacterium]|nr:50S ribosomal protein L15 [Deltaproteobacteria bacterium]
MRINDLSPIKGSVKKRKRVGRGVGSGHGKTSCRGHKGQKSRSGGGIPVWFEGGQMPIQRRLPKRGFNNIFKKEYSVINVNDLNGYEANATLEVAALMESGLVKSVKDEVKLLGNGEISQPLTIKVHKASKTAKEKIEALGGKIEMI